jgi:transitional endoplasmic reticulum ATPase
MLTHFTVAVGDALSFGPERSLCVLTVVPPGPATIGPDTIVSFRSGPRESGFLAPGGFDAEIAQVRERIELPMQRPDLFARLGVDPPRGLLISGPAGVGKSLIARAAAQACGATFFALSGSDIASSEAEAELRGTFERARATAPSLVFIDEIDALAPRLALLLSLLDGLDPRHRVLVLAATDRPDRLDPALRRPGRFDREFEIAPPDRRARSAILAAQTRFMPLAEDVDLERLAATAQGFVGADLAALVREAAIAALRRAPTHDVVVTAQDFATARLEVAPSAPREANVETPQVRFEAVGGHVEAKAALTEAVLLPLAHGALFAEFGVAPPRGVLLAGPPGVGKTRLAEALANEAGVDFLAVRGSEWLDGCAGTREDAIRRLFQKARRAAPAILFFDELDALAPRRGADAASPRDRAAAALIGEIDAIAGLGGVFLIGATDRLEALDPALRRPGRFDAVIALGPPDLAARRAIAALHAARLTLEDGALDRIAEATEGHVGADIAALCQRLGLIAVRRAAAGDRSAISEAEIADALAGLPSHQQGA